MPDRHNLVGFTDSHFSNATMSILTINTGRGAQALAVIGAVGLLVAAAPPLARAPVDNLAPLVFFPEPWPAPNAILQSGTLSFTGHSTVGDFVGTTTAVSGGVTGNAELANARGWAEAAVATLSTGNRLRDRDLRSTMEIAKYPTIRFELGGVSPTSPGATSDTVTAALNGALTIHGVTRDVAIPAVLIASADTIGVSGAFPIDLGDYKVEGLTRLFGTLRVRRNIEVRFHVRFQIKL
jgi:polyisoprenoid-binding protein YceI